MIRRALTIFALLLTVAIAAVVFLNAKPEPKAPAPEAAHAEGKAENAHGPGHGDATEITPDAAKAAGIKVEQAGPAAIHEIAQLTGRILLNQNKTAQVKARFPGVVREVMKGPGDTVAKDDVLAKVESNESLQTYAVKSPINGVILTRSTNAGDVAGDTPMFTITNPEEVWAEFHVFPRDIDRIRLGQKVLVNSFEGGHKGEGAIVTLLPVAESSSQTTVARVELPNPDGVWRAGMTVSGDAVLAERDVAVAVKNGAIQRLEGNAVVFVQEAEGKYEARTIKAGLSDSDLTEILEGLSAGDVYVSEGSFQIKANIGKAGAAHED